MYTQNFLKKTKILVITESKNIIEETAISTEQRRNLFLCLKEALNNAYKYSQSNQITLSFIQNDHEFVMKISDNGIGINHEKSEGNGLRNMKRRMHEQNGHCEITTENGTHLFFRMDL